jgi:hypothetical protein
MNNRDKILSYLQRIVPKSATNADIRLATQISTHQQVFSITRELRETGRIHGVQRGKEWWFSARSSSGKPETVAPVRTVQPWQVEPEPKTAMVAKEFEAVACKVMSGVFGTPLALGQVSGVPKTFDLVSRNGSIIGDAKFYTMVNGSGLPPAKFPTIAEYVWLLEKTGAAQKFMVFGNQRAVPEEWLKRYGHLLDGVEFYFIDNAGQVEKLT